MKQENGLCVDVWEDNDVVLWQAGVAQIENSRCCIAENLDAWYFYLKEKGITGRFAVVIALK